MNEFLPRFELYRPSSLDDALDFLDKHGVEAKPLAGGTELLVLIKDRRIPLPKYLVDLSRLKNELSYIRDENSYLRVGALTTIWELNQSILGRDTRYAGFQDVFHGFATMSLRFTATIGGNIVSATQYSDYITLLLVYNAKVKIRSINGERIVDLDKFLLDKRRVDLEPNELVVEIIIPKPNINCSSSFYKFDRRRQLIAGIVTGATLLCMDDDVIDDVKVSFDMVREKRIPGRLIGVEEYLRNKKFSIEEINKVSEEILPREIVRVSDWWTTAEYRLEMSKVVLRRNLIRSYERIKGGT